MLLRRDWEPTCKSHPKATISAWVPNPVASTCWTTKAPRICSLQVQKRIWKPKSNISLWIKTTCRICNNPMHNNRNRDLQSLISLIPLEMWLMLPTQTPEHIPRLTARRSTRTMLKLRLITSDQMQKESCRMTMRKTLKVKSILLK